MVRILAGAVLGLACALAPAWAADDAALLRMATCQDSWLDWSSTAPDKMTAFADHVRAGFTHKDNDPFGLPKTPVSIAGLRVVQAFPQSVGMGVGFSLMVEAGFDTARKAMEGVLGKKLDKCEASDGMHSCELEIADKRTFTLMAMDNDTSKTLAGCYYYYEK